MKLELLRYSSQANSTLGVLFECTVVRDFLCYTLEDQYQEKKIYGETRIPPGTYEIKLRKEGGYHDKYSKRFPKMHKGMLWLQNVPGFEYIYLHTGNNDKHTKGCILTGDSVQQNVTADGIVGMSTLAYERMYPPIAKYIDSGKKCYIKIIDYDAIKRS